MKQERNAYLSVGIDIGADFSLMAAALPTQELVCRSYKILHNSPRSVQGAVDRILSMRQTYDLPVRVYMESTGIYHLPLYHRFKDAGLDVFILNPIVTHANQNANIRNIHNDKLDARRIALLGLRPGLKTSIIPEDEIAAVKALLREYHVMKKETSTYICRLKNQLRQIFPQYLPLFSKVNGKASLAVLSKYPSPSAVLAAGADALTKLIRESAGRGEAMARKKAESLLSAAGESISFGHGNSGIIFLIGHYVEMIRILDKKTAEILKQIKSFLQERPDSLLTRQTMLLESIPGAGFLTAVTIVCEIGNFAAFRRPKQLYSYFGLDPVVRQSGNSAGANLRISKRGSPYARRCFYMLALQAVSLRKNGEPKNPVLRAYYLEKCRSKAKMTALGAVMHKLCNIVFAVLRDERPFVLISPQEHRQNYLAQAIAA